MNPAELQHRTNDWLTLAAADNNARWCDVVCRSHGLSTTFDEHAWRSQQRTPPLYPDAVTLAPTCSTTDFVTQIDASTGCSVKDSFATLDLSRLGFRVLFESQWIAQQGSVATAPRSSALAWRKVRTPTELEDWHGRWDHAGTTPGLFGPALLDEPGVSVMAAYATRTLVGGAILFTSSGVIGLTNYFCDPHHSEGALRGCLRSAQSIAPTLPVVGYAHGRELMASEAEGFTIVGPLRVWIRET